MADDDEGVSGVVRILMEEGFDALAGELLVAIANRRSGSSNERDDSDEEIQKPKSRRGDVAQAEPAETDLEFAMDFIHKRLVQPARALAEAERIAGDLAGGGPSEIRFVDVLTGSPVSDRGLAPAGESKTADDLEQALDRIGRRTGEDAEWQ